MLTSQPLFLGAALCCVAVLMAVSYRRRRPLADWDGPRQLPILGSILSLKGRLVVEACEEEQWHLKYGPAVKFSIGKRNCLLVTDAAAARELFGAPETQGRPAIPFYAKELGAFETITPMMAAHGSGKACVDMLRRAVLTSHRAISESIGARSSAAALLHLLEQAPSSHVVDLDYLVGGLARMNFMDVAYSEKLNTISEAMADDDIARLSQTFQDVTAFLNTSGELSVPFPILEWLLPLRSRRLRKAASDLRSRWTQCAIEMSDKVLRRYPGASKANRWEELPQSIFKECLLNDKVELPAALRSACGIALASMDTTSSSLKAVICALAYHPHLQKDLQRVIDEATPEGHIPTEAAATCKPEMIAFVRECLRLAPAIPIGIIRETTRDVVFQGRRIKAGTWLLPMNALINKDPRMYGIDADDFRPSRFSEALGADGKGLNAMGTRVGPLTAQGTYARASHPSAMSAS